MDVSDGEASLISHLAAAIPDELEELEDRYYELVPEDQELVSLFGAELASSPADFAPI